MSEALERIAEALDLLDLSGKVPERIWLELKPQYDAVRKVLLDYESETTYITDQWCTECGWFKDETPHQLRCGTDMADILFEEQRRQDDWWEQERKIHNGG